MTKLASWANEAYRLAERAGAAIMQIYRQEEPMVVQYKADHSPLTKADTVSHDILFEGLQALHLEGGPVPVLSEEGRAIPFVERQKWKQYWCVDPVDGTKDFLARTDEFTVNVALVIDNQPRIGIIYVPARETGYIAWHGGGAYRCDADGRTPIQTQRVCPKPLRLVVSRYQGLEGLQPWLSALGETTLAHRGSALKFCLLAEGEADLFLRLSPSSEWDNAAGQCILEEAGGTVFSWDGEPLPYNRSGTLEQKRFVAAGDPHFKWPNRLSGQGTK